MTLILLCAACDLAPTNPPDLYYGDDRNYPDAGRPATAADGFCAEFELVKKVANSPANVLILFGLRTCAGDGLPSFGRDDFLIEENGYPISSFEGDVALQNRRELYSIHTTLLLDVSNSVVQSADDLAALQTSVDAFQTQMPEGDMDIFVFDGSPNLRPFAIGDTLDETLTRDPSTNLNGAIAQGLEHLDYLREAFLLWPRRTFAGNLVVFTDGTDRAARVSESAVLRSVARTPHSIFTIGLGAEIDLDFLATVGRAGFRNADEFEDLFLIFRSIANDIKRQSRRFYALGYCSPLRAGTGRIALSLQNARNGAPLRTTFSAFRFGPGCSAETLSAELNQL